MDITIEDITIATEVDISIVVESTTMDIVVIVIVEGTTISNIRAIMQLATVQVIDNYNLLVDTIRVVLVE